jgi:hypothetical protein
MTLIRKGLAIDVVLLFIVSVLTPIITEKQKE